MSADSSSPSEREKHFSSSQSSGISQPYSIYRNPIHESPKQKKCSSESANLAQSEKGHGDSPATQLDPSPTTRPDESKGDQLLHASEINLGTDHKAKFKNDSFYIEVAAKQIALARSLEDNQNIQAALDMYTEGVGTLLSGVKADPDKLRRNVVKVRTAQYLQRAERLVARLTKRDTRFHDSQSWIPVVTEDSLVLPPSYLKNYRVFGVSGKIILAIDNSTKETVAIKVLKKSRDDRAGNVILPVDIPNMVPLIKYHETEFAIYLVLKYISGGKLLQHISSYINQAKSKDQEPFSCIASQSNFIYAGCRLISEELPANLPKSRNVADQEAYLPPPSNAQGAGNHTGSSLLLSRSIEQLNVHEEAVDDSLETNATEAPFADEVNKSSDTLSFLSEDFDISGMSSIDNSCIEIVEDDLQISCRNPHFSSISSRDVSHKVLVRDESCSLNELDLYSSGDSSVHCTSHCAKSSLSESCMTLSRGADSKEANPFTLNIDDLIRNSKRLLSNVTQTLEMSKSQALKFPSDVIPTTNTRLNCDNQSSLSLNENLPSNDSSKPVPCPPCSLDGSGHFPSSTCSVYNDLPCKIEGEPQDAAAAAAHGAPSKGSRDPLSLDSARRSPLSLSKLLERYSSQANLERMQLPENLVKVWISQVVSAIHGLHNLGIIWGDFNISNVLLDDGGSILVTYESRWPCVQLRRKCPQSNDGGYIAPELISPLCQPGISSDWWSIGALLYHLLTGSCVSDAHPTGVLSHTEILLPYSLSREAQSIVAELLRFDPKERLGGGTLGVQEIKEHPFFMGVQWDN